MFAGLGRVQQLRFDALLILRPDLRRRRRQVFIALDQVQVAQPPIAGEAADLLMQR